MESVILNYRVIQSLPEDWQKVSSWPGKGAWRVIDGVCDNDLYFVTDHFVSVSFDVLAIIDSLYDISDEKIDPMAKMWAEVAIQTASKSSQNRMH